MADHEPVDGGFGQMELVLEEPRDPPSASYDYQWRRFESWAERSGKSALPASPKDVAEYLLVRSGPGGSPSTLRVIVAAIARKHRDAEMDNPCEHKTVKPVISSLTLAGTGKPRRVCPLQLEGYRAIRERAFMPRRGKGGRMERDSTARRRGAIDVAMIGLMRDARLSVREASELTWSDIERVRGGTGWVRIRGAEKPEPRIVSSDTMKLLSSIRRGAGDDEQILGLSPSQIAVRIRDAAKQAGLGGGFNGGSPRQGMIRDLETLGVLLLAERLHAES